MIRHELIRYTLIRLKLTTHKSTTSKWFRHKLIAYKLDCLGLNDMLMNSYQYRTLQPLYYHTTSSTYTYIQTVNLWSPTEQKLNKSPLTKAGQRVHESILILSLMLHNTKPPHPNSISETIQCIRVLFWCIHLFIF